MVIFVVRHPYTEANVKKISQGHSDSKLIPEGIEMAHKLGKKLRNKNIGKILTSDLGRCVQTSNIINEYLQVPIIKSKELREQNLGKYNGKPKLEIKKEFDENDYKAIPKDGESLLQVKDRIIKFIQSLSTKEVILIVTHTGCFQSILSEAYGVSLDNPKCRTTPLTIAKFSIGKKIRLLSIEQVK